MVAFVRLNIFIGFFARIPRPVRESWWWDVRSRRRDTLCPLEDIIGIKRAKVMFAQTRAGCSRTTGHTALREGRIGVVQVARGPPLGPSALPAARGENLYRVCEDESLFHINAILHRETRAPSSKRQPVQRAARASNRAVG